MPFRNYRNILDKGEAFFHKHGAKSVVIGRFFGPVRSLTPLIAGVLKMSRGRFLLAVIPSAVGWAFLYLIPGVLIGKFSQQLPKHLATKVILYALAIIILAWLIGWLIKLGLDKINGLYGDFMAKTWKTLNQHPRLQFIPNSIRNAYHPMHYQPLSLMLVMITSCFLFLWLVYQVHVDGFFLALNPALHEVLQHLPNDMTTQVMAIISELGYVYVLLGATGLILLWLGFKKNYWVAVHLLALMLGTSFVVKMLKKVLYSPRPSGSAFISDTSSFPSGHTTLSTALFFFLAYLVVQNISKLYRNIPYVIASFLIVLIICSRLYLGMHWFTDVLAGLTLGITLLIPVIISLQHKRYHPIEPQSFIIAFSASILISWLIGIWYLIS